MFRKIQHLKDSGKKKGKITELSDSDDSTFAISQKIRSVEDLNKIQFLEILIIGINL